MKALMIQGTSSGCGKSFITTAICAYLNKSGIKVAPFKAQNMSLNAVATEEGEIAWAQFVQALASGTKPSVLMNPILLKPMKNHKSELIIMGQSRGLVHSENFDEYRKKVRPIAFEAFEELSRKYDVIIAEGAGSPVEINIKKHDFTNMGLATHFNIPVIIVADIDRGGVFAQMVGTMELLEKEEKDLVRGFIINKFRGNLDILKPGIEFIEKKINKKVIAVINFKENLLPPEDSLDIRNRSFNFKDKIAVVKYPRMSNFTDIMPFWVENVDIIWAQKPHDLDGAKAIILPGSRCVIEDLRWMKENGIFEKIKQLYQKGVFIFGVCGGYQMMGNILIDNVGNEGGGVEEGLGFFDFTIEYAKSKAVKRIKAMKTKNISWIPDYIEGYVIKTAFMSCKDSEFIFKTDIGGDGHIKERCFGTHVHDIFSNDDLRTMFLKMIGIKPTGKSYKTALKETFEELSSIIENNKPLLEEINVIIGK